MHVGKSCRIVLLVADWESSVAFYEDLFGREPQVRHPGWAVFDCGVARDSYRIDVRSGGEDLVLVPK
jgi:catechol 2,3-dioxygenase-like lactoylglutathione lyase family enzyme